MTHKPENKQCAKNNTVCAVYHVDGVCPGYGQYVACTCGNNLLPTCPPEPSEKELDCACHERSIPNVIHTRKSCKRIESDKACRDVPDSKVEEILAEFEEKFMKLELNGGFLLEDNSTLSFPIIYDWLTTILETLSQSEYARGCDDTHKKYSDYCESVKTEAVKWDKEAHKEVIEAVKKLITAEMLIAQFEGTPTSRLTSLWNQVDNLKS